MCDRLLDHGGKRDVGRVLLLCELGGPVESRPVIRLSLLWLWGAM